VEVEEEEEEGATDSAAAAAHCSTREGVTVEKHQDHGAATPAAKQKQLQ
jgi:hypothetical protein